MAKSRFSIIMDYFNALHQAELLDKAADKLRSSATLADGYINYLRSAWTGDNAAVYINKLQILKDNLSKQEKNLKLIAETVRRIAKRTYDTEMRSLEISRKRTY